MPPGRPSNSQPKPAVSDPYQPLVELVMCTRCGSVIGNTEIGRRAHDALHVGLRRLWQAIEGRTP